MDLQERISRFITESSPPGQAPRVEGLRRLGTGSAGASRENWVFDLVPANGAIGERRACILRRDPPKSLLEAGVTTDRTVEFALLKTLERFPVRAPRVYWLDADGSRLERPSIIMHRMEGHASPTSTLPSYEPAELKTKLADQFIQLLCNIHAVDWRNCGLGTVFKVPENGRAAAQQQVDLWTKVYLKDRTEPLPPVDLALRWLNEHLPKKGEVTIVHGDYRSGNYLYDDAGTLHAVLDWELTHLGDPVEDVAWACLKFWANRDGWASGLLPVDEFCREYARRSGREVDPGKFRFYRVLANVKTTAIFLSGVRVFCEGTRPSAQLGILGFLIPRIVEDTLSLISN
ncbi:MAG: phosphotransferase family protein [Nitrospirae bacterium]|nr:phosphotransferase family protein [Nitrospirota bacterium]